MWIRSQDKTVLINANEIWLFQGHAIYANATSNEDSAQNLGFYESGQRALEVLDEIQMQIQSCAKTIIGNTERITVFDMPEK